MSRLFYHVMQDNVGNLLFDVSGTMRIAGSGTLATIYGDEALTIPIANPMTNHPSFGSFKCFLGAGDYDFYMAKSGYTFETLTGVQGLGTMAQQDASAVAVSGGTAVGMSLVRSDVFSVLDHPGNDQYAFYTTMNGGGGTNRWALHCAGDANSYLNGAVFCHTPTSLAGRLSLLYERGTEHGIVIKPVNDSGGTATISFANAAGTQVGTIQTTGAATSYNTTSDVRLKHAVEGLTGELALIQALRPVSFLWNADETPGVGFLASEVAQHVQGVVTGDEDAVDEHGGIVPQMIDYSKLVPFLVGAIKTLTARLVVLEDALGI